MTTVVHVRDGFNAYIGRAHPQISRIIPGGDGYFGNPFALTRRMSRMAAVERYRAYFLDRIVRDPEFADRTLKLRGLRLGCWCRPEACHGDIIVEWLEASP